MAWLRQNFCTANNKANGGKAQAQITATRHPGACRDLMTFQLKYQRAVSFFAHGAKERLREGGASAPGPQSRPLVVASRRFAAKEERLSQVSSQPKERDRVAAGALSRREA